MLQGYTFIPESHVVNTSKDIQTGKPSDIRLVTIPNAFL